MRSDVLPATVRALYPFESHYYTLSDGTRMHYVDDGPPEGDVLIFAHSYPLWSFEFRALIVYYAAQGYRCVAMDYIGYGLSDKPGSRRYHTLRRHTYNLIELIGGLELRNVTLVVEDWGGPLGLGYAIRHVENVKRLVIMNTWAFQQSYVHRLHPLVHLVTRPGVGELLFGPLNLAFTLGVQHWTARELSPTVLQAYKVPFRDMRNRGALVQFPRMISTSASHPSAGEMRDLEARLTTLQHIPTLLVWGQNDPIFTPDVAQHWKQVLPRAQGPHFIAGAGHYPTEDAPDALVQQIDRFLESTERGASE